MRPLALAVFLTLAATLSGAADLRSVLPAAETPSGWFVQEPPRVFSAGDAFELVDGGAELYLEYGLHEVASAVYAGAPGDTVQLEVWRMRDSAAACGVYSVTRADSGTPLGLGQEGTGAGYYLSFWSGAYFVTVTGSRNIPTVRSAVEAIGIAVAGNLPAAGKVPTLFAQLPATGLRTRRFVRGNIALSNVRGFAAAQSFKIQEAAVGEYLQSRYAILVYDSPEAAATSFRGAVEKMNLRRDPPSDSSGIEAARGTTTDGNPVAARRDHGTIYLREGAVLDGVTP